MADGILIIDKPPEWSSHDVVAKMRGILKTRRIGHTGTLDPFATGVLVVCINRATRLVQFLNGHEKEYIATVRLGVQTDTGDLTGQPLGEPIDALSVTEADITAALDHFRGSITQIPPMYSAKKIGGKRLYELARAGKEIERPPIHVTIPLLELLGINEAGEEELARKTLDVTIRVVCTAGTYIRTLAEDIGKLLSVGAHLTTLRRTRAGNCRLEDAVTLGELAEIVQEGRLGEILRPMAIVLDLPMLTVTVEEKESITHGRKLNRPGPWADLTQVALGDGAGELLAIAEYLAESELLKPRVVFCQNND